MNTRQLRHFIVLAETGSYRRAAERLNLTQPALTRSIQALEQDLGGRLIDRIGRRNEISAFGRTLLARAARIVADIEDLAQSAARQRKGLTGAISVGLDSGPGAILTMDLMRHVVRHYPQAQLNIASGAVPLQLQLLKAGELDLIVADSRVLLPDPDIVAERLDDMAAGFLCRKEHPLAKMGTATIEAVRGFPVVSTPLSDEIAHELMARVGPLGDPRTLVTLRCEDLPACVEVARTTDAIYLGVIAAAGESLTSGDLTPLDVGGYCGAARYSIISLARRSTPPLAPAIRAFIRDRMAAASRQSVGAIATAAGA